MAKTFRDWNVEQHWLLPPSVMDFVPADHIAHFIRDTVREQLDLSTILAPYEKEERGYPPYHPVMMTALLLYAYCQGGVFVAPHRAGVRGTDGLHGGDGTEPTGFPDGEGFSPASPGCPARALLAAVD